jgi:hypothetical protein
MAYAEADEGLPAISICPRCGARFVAIRAEADLDDELKAWLQESHDVVGMQSDLRAGVRGFTHEAHP